MHFVYDFAFHGVYLSGCIQQNQTITLLPDIEMVINAYDNLFRPLKIQTHTF